MKYEIRRKNTHVFYFQNKKKIIIIIVEYYIKLKENTSKILKCTVALIIRLMSENF